MYSAVLVTALVTASSAPNFGWRHGHGCYSSCHGCYSYGCYSGHAAPGWGYGAAGGCYGYHGGCYGAFGVHYADPHSYFGGPYMNYPPHAFYGCTGCYGAYGGYSCYGVPVPPVVMPPVVQPGPPKKDSLPPIKSDGKKDTKEPEEVGAPKEKVKPKTENKKSGLEATLPLRAKVRIVIPAGGRLLVDGNRIDVAAGVRTFRTPILSPGQAYVYDIRIEIERNGIVRGENRRLVIRAGEELAVNFPTLQSSGTQTAQVGK